ncbi:ubiquinone biosynthesis accessory factor UbiJ [Aliivibrio kagoshimensis]|uniref:ubiquinone biosynthesis accessory factor UbiJ n=1 Tax=Aliivibrio kagoshimensis TaxID=2910230 RepID=UPI003D0CF639
MPLDPFVTGIVETAINKLIKDEPQVQPLIARLKGQVIHIHLNELNKDLIFIFSHRIDVLAHYEGEPDCYLGLDITALPELRDQNNITRLIKEDKIVLEGELKLAQQFSMLLAELKPDIAEQLSRYTGDIVAHTVVREAKRGTTWLKNATQRSSNQLAEALTEEWRVAPPALEIAHFCDQVSELEQQFSQLEKRLHQLSKQDATKTKGSNH